jgi:hypothetical protein
MTSLTSASNNLGESEFIHYNTYDTTPIPAYKPIQQNSVIKIHSSYMINTENGKMTKLKLWTRKMGSG